MWGLARLDIIKPASAVHGRDMHHFIITLVNYIRLLMLNGKTSSIPLHLHSYVHQKQWFVLAVLL
jgi:hypothetical protein